MIDVGRESAAIPPFLKMSQFVTLLFSNPFRHYFQVVNLYRRRDRCALPPYKFIKSKNWIVESYKQV